MENGNENYLHCCDWINKELLIKHSAFFPKANKQTTKATVIFFLKKGQSY